MNHLARFNGPAYAGDIDAAIFIALRYYIDQHSLYGPESGGSHLRPVPTLAGRI